MTDAKSTLGRLLDYLEPRIDLAHVEQVAARHRAALNYESVDRLPLVCYLPYEGEDFAPFPYPEAFAEPAKMMVNELLVGFTSIYHAVDLPDDAPYCLRPNLGVTIIASMFGAQLRLLDDDMPWVEPLAGGLDDIRALVDAPLPDLDAGLLPRVLDQYAFFREVLADYANCRAAFQLTLPDLQGPFSIAELLWDADIYLAFFDYPDLLKALQAKITDLMLVVYDRLKDEVRDNMGPDYQYQHAAGVKGKLLVRDDSAINISPAQYREFVQPYNARLAAELVEIGIHFCGDGQHQVGNMLSIPGLSCLDLGQPEMMDLDRLYAAASAEEVSLLRMTVPETELTAERVKQRFPTGVNLVYEAESVAQAHDVWRRYCGQEGA